MFLSELKAGDTIETDDGFTCLPEGSHAVEKDEGGDLYIKCKDGKHLLEGQEDDETGELVGISWPWQRRAILRLSRELVLDIPDEHLEQAAQILREESRG